MQIETVLASGLPTKTLLDAFVRTAEPKDKPISSRYACLKAHKELHALGKTDTPYGTLVERGVVEGYVDNARVDMAIAYINPFALLYLACARSLQVVALLKKTVARSPTGKFRLAYYIDETTPGNVHNWDHCRATQCMYWTSLDWPYWFRSRAAGWLTFSYVLVNDMSEYGVSQSALIRFMFNRFFSADGWDFGVSGIRVPDGDDMFHFLAEFEVFIADERAHKAVFNLIGSGGSLPCGTCRNCFGRCPPFTDEYLQHVSSTEYEKFDPRTEDDYAEAARKLKATVDSGAGPTAIKKGNKRLA